MATVLLILLGAGFGYLLLCLYLARLVGLDDADVERLRLPVGAGHHIALSHHSPARRSFAEPVILCPGLGANRFNLDFCDDGRGGDRLSLARALARCGFDAWVLEPRGAGRAALPDSADWSVDDHVGEDVPAAIRFVLDRSGAGRVFWVGHSMGGLLQYLFQARGHELAARVAGMVTLGSPGTLRHAKQSHRGLRLAGWLFIDGLHTAIPLTLLARLLLPLAGLIWLLGRRLHPTVAGASPALLRRILTSVPGDIARGVARQLSRWADAGRFIAPDGTADEDRFPAITVPALLLAGAADQVVPLSAVAMVAERLGSEDKTLIVCGRDEGMSRDYGHGDLVVSLTAPDEVFPLIESWLAERATAV